MAYTLSFMQCVEAKKLMTSLHLKERNVTKVQGEVIGIQ
jgi:hypothetical protein